MKRFAQALCRIAVALLICSPALLPLTGQTAIIPVAQTEPR
jgi:hypothetical protein